MAKYTQLTREETERGFDAWIEDLRSGIHAQEYGSLHTTYQNEDRLPKSPILHLPIKLNHFLFWEIESCRELEII